MIGSDDAAAMRSLAAIIVCCLAVPLTGCDSAPVRPASVAAPRSVAAVHLPAEAPLQRRQTPLPPLQQDGAPAAAEIPPDLVSVPDAVPQAEPLSSSGNPDSYEVYGDRYVVLKNPHGYKERGRASWYGTKFHGKRTSSGEVYDMFKMTAAHKTLPIPCYARVTNLDNGKSVVVRINDRGPFHDGRIIDLSYTAAMKLGSLGNGSIPVEVEALDPGTRLPPVQLASAAPMPVVPLLAPAPPTIVVPAAAPPSPAGSAPVVMAPVQAALPPAHYLQAGLFNDPINAVTMREQLNGIGISNVKLISAILNGNRVNRVLIGPFRDVDALAAMRKHLSDLQVSSVPVLE